MKIPVIIHYKHNGKDNGRDLKMTLRSFEMFMPEVGDVVIVGDDHDWLTGVTHIPFRHPYRANKDANIIMACLKGAIHLLTDRGHEGDVVVASDDCVLLSPYCNGLYFEEQLVPFMEGFPFRVKDNRWWERPYQSMVHCISRGWTADHCEAHVPQFLSIGSILTVLDAKVGECPLGAKTLMVNAERTIGMREAELVNQHKIHPDKLTPEVIATPGGPRFCNWCPTSESDTFHENLLKIFPSPSRYEKHAS